MTVIAAVCQILGIFLAPFLPGLVQTAKARLQGRRGPTPLQPYWTLTRLWHRSTVTPEGTTFVYRLAPPLIAACLGGAILLVPVAGRAGSFGLGHDALVLVALLALARFASAAASWDTSNGFSLMGTAKDLMFAVFAEALLVATLLIAAVPAHSSDLRSMSQAAAGGHIWGGPAHWCGVIAFALVILLETGRQPIDNPDSHLELTMIHEGPLLEYAGPDLAYLQWSAAAHHWVVLMLGADLFLPRPHGFGAALAVQVGWVLVMCLALAAVETSEAKMRIMRVPPTVLLACLVALAGAGLAVGGLG